MLVAEFTSKFLENKQIENVFCVTGGYAMFLNNFIGINKNIKTSYFHNEQGAGYAAVGYAKSINKPCVVSTTAGVAATNTLSSVLVAWQESLPILYISGQVNSYDTIKHKGNIRHYSGQDCNICEIAKSITKYSYEIHDASEISYHLEKAYHELTTGRPGPCFISIPIDIQNTEINIDKLPSFTPNIELPPSYDMNEICDEIKKSKRPLLLLGGGVKISKAENILDEFLKQTQIPVVTTYNGIDCVSSESPLYIGRCGINGDRSGNFTVQNCDLLISLGCRLGLCVIGYNHTKFSRESKKIMVDIDQTELDKSNVDFKINSDIKTFLHELIKLDIPKCNDSWLEKTTKWKSMWFRDLPPDMNEKSPYNFYRHFMRYVPKNSCLVSSSGSIHTPLMHSFNDYGKNIKFIMNSATGDMGSELPGSLGMYLTGKFDNVICVVGDGSFMFNLQELQTISYHKTNIKIIIMNNNGYESIRVSQRNYFGNILGTDDDSGLSFPNFSDVAHTFNLKYHLFEGDYDTLGKILCDEQCHIIEVKCTPQDRHPKLASKRNEKTGKLESRPLEEMTPFLDDKVFREEMIVNTI